MSDPRTKNERHMVAAIEGEYRRHKSLGEGTFSQLEARDFVVKTTPESLSVAMIAWHVSGNLESRFTDFLTTDGEKPWRDRESEFADRQVGRKDMLAKWERGWGVLFDALAALTDADLRRTVTIRGIPATVGEALARSLAHTSYHVGQITFLGKMLRRSRWKYLSIPPGMSSAYNAGLGGTQPSEKARRPAERGTGSRKPAAKAAATRSLAKASEKQQRRTSSKRPAEVSRKRPAKASGKTSGKPAGKAKKTSARRPPKARTKKKRPR